MASEPADLAQILRTTLHLVERRRDLDQQAPAVSELKESMRRTIAELEQRRSSAPVEEPPKTSLWARALRWKRESKQTADAEAQ